MATLMRYVSVYHAPVCCLSTHAPVSPRPAQPRPSILCRTSLLPIWSSVHLLSGHATRGRRHATHATRNSHRTSHTLNIQLFSHLFQIYNCFLCSHTHRLKLAFGTWLVVCSVEYYRLECRVESFNWRKERKFLDGFQVWEMGTPLVCCVY